MAGTFQATPNTLLLLALLTFLQPSVMWELATPAALRTSTTLGGRGRSAIAFHAQPARWPSPALCLHGSLRECGQVFPDQSRAFVSPGLCTCHAFC